jgi:DNA-binding CsgD family transcriptional regulator
VHNAVVRTALDAARAAGVTASSLVQGLGLVSDEIRRASGWSKWRAWAELCERIEREFLDRGRSDAFGEHFHRQLPVLGAVGGLMATPQALYQTMFDFIGLLFRNVEGRCVEVNGRLDLELRLPTTDREGLAFFRLGQAVLRFVPLHVGLPPANVDILVATHRARFVVEPPMVAPLEDRLKRGLPGFASGTLEQARLFAGLLEELVRPPSPRHAPRESIAGRTRALTDRWSLTQRQAEVLSLVAHGSSNKEIAQQLGCSDRTVEVHVTQILKKAQASGRGPLIARFWLEPDQE